MTNLPPPPPTADQLPVDLPPPVPSAPRRYDLDVLRATAMFLGVVLHAAIPFIPYWEEGDTGGGLLWALFEYIHAWRMPLFFLLSGYFTTMLWRRRGLRALVVHRLRRIALPLVVGVGTILPLVIFGFVIGFAISGATEDDLGAIAAADNYEDPNAEADEEASGEQEDEEDPFGFAHLWFLWHLLWMVAGFAVAALVLDGIRRQLGRDPPGRLGLALGWLLPVATLPFYFTFSEDVIGPDTSDSFIPAANVLLYYACFFAFGALRYRLPDQEEVLPIDRLGRAWAVQLPASLVLFVLLYSGNFPVEWEDYAAVALAWIVCFGSIGLFRTFASAPSFRARWLSDGAYWMYLIHLPMVFVLQGVAVALGLGALPGFVFIVAVVSLLLVLTYRYLVRYTPIGIILNGERTREGDDRLRLELSGDPDPPTMAVSSRGPRV